MDDRYRGVYGQRQVLFINEQDRIAIACAEGALVNIESWAADGQPRRVKGFKLVDYAIPRGCIAAYYPETNALVPLESHAIGARTPTSKSIPVRLSAAS
jgi:anaerobic selenocysteine-containing dehydrogenase